MNIYTTVTILCFILIYTLMVYKNTDDNTSTRDALGMAFEKSFYFYITPLVINIVYTVLHNRTTILNDTFTVITAYAVLHCSMLIAMNYFSYVYDSYIARHKLYSIGEKMKNVIYWLLCTIAYTTFSITFIVSCINLY